MKCILNIIMGAAVLLFLAQPLYSAENPRRDRQKLAKGTIFQWKQLDGNRINCTVASDGPYADNRKSGQAGLEWPKGSGKTPIFTAGIWLGGVHRPTGQIRMAQMDYSSEYQAGPVIGTFNTTTNEDAAHIAAAGDARYRIYKINKRDTTGLTDNADFDEWPGDLGAPYEDRNANGQWDPGVDMPKFYGDQQMWFVINDINRALHQAVSLSPPMGVEIQNLYFVFNQVGPLGDMMFMKWRIINKSDADYDSVFIGMWSDPDLGDAGDDMPGCDTLLSLGYIYNADNDDGTAAGYGTPPPAAGWDFFQGPWVPSAGDSALFDGTWIMGRKNLPASSFVVYMNGNPNIQDPPDGSPEYIPQAYDYLNGKAGTIHQALYRTDGSLMKYWLSGDPVTGTGDLPANFPLGALPPFDYRLMTNAGPFTLAKGDTQEIVGAWMIAQGSSNLNSITKLKQIDGIAQQSFNDNFQVASAPPLPNIKVTELEDRVILDWKDNSEVTEAYDFRKLELFGYRYQFQAYRLYQLTDPSDLTKPFVEVGLWDIKDNVKLVEDYETDPISGNAYLAPVLYAKDSGLQRYFIVEKDYLLNSPLVRGKRYYFALTTVAYNILGISPKLIEGPKDAISGQPGRSWVTAVGQPVGTTLTNDVGDVIMSDRDRDDNVSLYVADPAGLTGDSYKVTFNGVDTAVVSWNLIRNGVDTLIENNTFLDASLMTNMTDGVVGRVKKYPYVGLKRDDETPRGYNYTGTVWFTGAASSNLFAMNGGADFVGSQTFVSRNSKVHAKDMKRVEIRFGETQKAFRYAENLRRGFTTLPPIHPEYAPYYIRTGVGGVYQDWVDVPFTVWEIDPNDGNAAARQLNVGFLERNDTLYTPEGAFKGFGQLNGAWNPLSSSSGGREIMFIFASDYTTDTTSLLAKKYMKNYPQNTTNLNGTLPANYLTDVLGVGKIDSLDMMYVVWVRKTDSTKTFKTGDRLTLNPRYLMYNGLEYNFVTKKPTKNDVALAKTQLDKIQVFPNPYFAHNRAEQNPLQRFVTFSRLGGKAKIRIFSLAGELVKTLNYDDAVAANRTFIQWDLRNENGLPVASGMYIAHIEVEGVGNRILKFAIIQPEERPTRIQ